MDERQKLQSDLTRYRTLRGLVSDEQTIQAIQQLIREAEDRLVQIEPFDSLLNQKNHYTAP